MPKPTPLPLRQAILEETNAGLSARQIGERLGLSVRTVERLATRFRKAGGAALAPKPAVPPPRRPHDAASANAACSIRTAAPAWSSVVIRCRLQLQHPRTHVASARTIRRWLAKAGVPRVQVRDAWRGPMLRLLLEAALGGDEVGRGTSS